MDTCLICPRNLVETPGFQTRARSTRESSWTPHDLGSGPESPGISGRTCGPLDQGASRLEQLVDPRDLGHGPESHGTADRPLRQSDTDPIQQRQLIETADPRIWARVVWERWSTPRELRRTSESTRSVVTPRALGPDCEYSRTAGGHLENSDTGAIRPGQLVDPAGPRPWALVTQDIYRPRGHLDMAPSRPGLLVEPARSQTLARVVQASW